MLLYHSTLVELKLDTVAANLDVCGESVDPVFIPQDGFTQRTHHHTDGPASVALQFDDLVGAVADSITQQVKMSDTAKRRGTRKFLILDLHLYQENTSSRPTSTPLNILMLC